MFALVVIIVKVRHVAQPGWRQPSHKAANARRAPSAWALA